MDFREYAAHETTTLVHQLLASSAEGTEQQLEKLRAALQAAAEALDASRTPAAATERALAELAARLNTAAAEASDEAVRRAADEAQKVQAGLSARLDSAVRERDAAAASLQDAQAEAEAVRREVTLAAQRADAANLELTATRRLVQELEAAQLALAAERDEEGRRRGAVEQELHQTRQRVDDVQSQLALVNRELESTIAERAAAEEATSIAQSQAQAAEAKLTAVTELLKTSAGRLKMLERAHAEQDRRIRELDTRLKTLPTAAHDRTASRSITMLDDLLGGFQALAAARSIDDVFTTLVEQLAGHFPRVAMFRVKGSHLQGEHQIGFESKTDIAKIMVPLGMESPLTRVVTSGRIERLSETVIAESTGALFSGTPTCALAIPVAVGRETLAVIYADDSGAAHAGAAEAVESSVRLADAMHQHAVALLLRRCDELKMRAELRAYVGSLVDEIEQMYASDVAAGKSGRELQARLRANVEYARSIYANRVAIEGADAAGLLEDHLAALIDARHDTPLARDLAAIVDHASTRRAAEAS
jgi:hypothetical protein